MNLQNSDLTKANKMNSSTGTNCTTLREQTAQFISNTVYPLILLVQYAYAFGLEE